MKTGFKHLDADSAVKQSFLQPPGQEESLPALLPILKLGGGTLDLNGNGQGKASSLVIIFTCWNTMVGSAMTTIPWAFQQSGILMGIFISFIGFLTSYYTCSLIIKTAKKDTDYIFTLKKYFGKQGFYIGLIGPTVLIFGAITVYFVVIV